MNDMNFIGGGFADHTTPLVLNCWYVAGLSGEITRDILSRRLLGTEVALYRTLAGAPVAVRNRCPHRSFPLAKGRLDGDTLALPPVVAQQFVPETLPVQGRSALPPPAARQGAPPNF